MKRSVSNLKRAILLWRKNAKVRLMARMAYPGNFFILTISVIAHMVLNIVFMNVIFNFVSDFSGWTYREALVIIAGYMIIDGINWALFANLTGITRNIVNGDMDFVLVKPLDTQLYVSIYRADPEDWSRVVLGVAVLIYAIAGLNLSGWALSINLLLYSALLLSGIVIFYSINLIIKSISFWTIQGWGLQPITEAILYGSRFPTGIFTHKFVRIFFYTALPIAFLASVPAEFLVKLPDFYLLGASFLIAIVFFYVSRKFFYFALSHYASASS
ncbi:hypothetical protein A2303_01240 [Candidatus Falkowbacteria bacterium RIFOXYB2_FULL_47_14]|nr:MAG: hypothetical protein A2468_04580 [Candidatus Falkowbacteria bacterium RIFOXYC2_FULL_46_15]OGF43515.1 MAG: hypothetical protein A2303_01240 [Candidatus Falkowbacteria bacterium RIFOXYB2_FULL_47_14]